MKVSHFACGPFANDSERKAFEHVRSRLASTSGDDAWVLLTNLAFSVTHRMQADEIDLVAIGPPGVRVVDWRDAIGFDAAEPATLRPPQVAMLSRLLEPKSAVALDGSLRRFAGYVNLELRTPKTERFHRVYAGVHSARQDRVVLHVYDLSARDDANAEKVARREFEALRRLQLHDWAPRILDSFQDAPGYSGEMRFFTVVDPAAPSIEKRKPDASWATLTRLVFARNAVRALRELHDAGADDAPVAHRNLTARTILVRHDGKPIFTGFEWSKIPSDVSIASSGAPVGGWEPETATVHAALCGVYIRRRAESTPNGGWRGPFASRQDALKFAESTGRRNVKMCSRCR